MGYDIYLNLFDGNNSTAITWFFFVFLPKEAAASKWFWAQSKCIQKRSDEHWKVILDGLIGAIALAIAISIAVAIAIAIVRDRSG